MLTTDLDAYNTDWLGTTKGHSSLVLLPRSTEDVSEILKYAHREGLKCVVQSGNTSLVAGAVPVADEVVINMRRLNRILSLDEHSGVVRCEAGVVLETLERFVNDHHRLVPYDLGAKGSCLVGGNVATNAGGLRFIRYGPLHGTVVGLEVVLADGTVLDLMSAMRKDNTGYHLRQLFIGSEGTLGVITKVALFCPMAFKHRTAALLALPDFPTLLSVFRVVQAELGEYLSCFEMFDQSSLEAVVENLKYPKPFPDAHHHPFYAMFELSGNDGAHLETRLLALLERLWHSSQIREATYAPDSQSAKFAQLRNYREHITLGLRADGAGYKYDVSLPLPVFYEVVEVMRERLLEKEKNSHEKPFSVTRVCGYGHLGDGNLHFNVTSPTYQPALLAAIEPALYELVAAHGGSISAEHGIGAKKRPYLRYSKSAEAVRLMGRLKAEVFDVRGTLNPGKVL